MRVCGIDLLSNTGVRNTGFREGGMRTLSENMGSGLQMDFRYLHNDTPAAQFTALSMKAMNMEQSISVKSN
jgi:hypothetical protein